MDYFEFDLQLFAADVTVPLTGKKMYYVKHEGEEKEWIDGTTTPLAATDTVIAKIDNSTLTVVAASDETVEIQTGDANGAALKGLTVAVASAISNTGTVTTGDITGVTVTFANNAATPVTLGAVGAVASGGAGILFDATTLMQATVVAGNTVGNMTVKAGKIATVKMDTNANNYVLVNGDVTVAKDKVVTVGANTFTTSNVEGTYALSVDSANSLVTASEGIVATGTNMTAGEDGATFKLDATDADKLSLENGEADIANGATAVIHDITYTNAAPSSPATVVAGDGTVELTDGKVSFDTADASLISGAMKVTNTKADKAVTVDATDGVTTEEGGTATVEVVAGKGATISSKTYTNASISGTAKLTVEGASSGVTLTSGYITIADAAITTSAGVITETAGEEITVSATGEVSNIADDAEFTYGVNANGTAKIGDANYKNTGNAVATLTVTDKGKAINLTTGTFDVTNESAVITLADTSTVQNFGAAKLTVDATNVEALSADSGAVYKVVLADTKTLTVAGKTYTASDAAATLDVNGSAVTLTNGNVTMALTGTSVTTDIGTITYTKTVDANDGIKVTKAGVVSDNDQAGDVVTVVLAAGETYGTLYKNASSTETATLTFTTAAGGTTTPALADGSVFLLTNAPFTVNGTEITADGAHPIAIDTTGNVSKIPAGASFTTTNASTGASYSYTMTGTTLAKTGDAVGVYANAGGATVDTAGAVTGGTLQEVTLTLAADNANVSAKGDAGKTVKYYALFADGEVGDAAYDDVDDAQSGATALGKTLIGCFKAVTSWENTDGAKPAVTVTFVGNLTTEANPPTNYLGNVTVDATAVEKITVGGANATDLGTLVVTGIATTDTDISVVGLNKNAEVSTSIGSITNLPEAPEVGLTVTFNTERTTGAKAMNAKPGGTFTNYGVYASIGEGEYAWYDTVADVKAAATTAGDTYTIGARYQNGVLTVANGGTGKQVTLANDALTDDSLEGVSIQVVASFDANGNASTTTGTGIVSFTAADEAGIAITTALGESVKFEDNALQATIPAGATVVSNGNTYTVNAESVMTLAATGTNAKLDNGNVTVAAGKELAVGNNTYTAGKNGAQITSTATEFNTDGTVKTAATYGTLAAGEVTVKAGQSGICVADGDNLSRVASTSTDITVTSAGVVSGLANGQVITVTDVKSDGTDDTATTTYTVGAAGTSTITVSGKYAGVYKFDTDDAKKAATITSVYGAADTITSVGAAMSPVPLDYNGATTRLILESGTDKDYYGVTAAGVVQAGSNKNTAKSGTIGYFHVETSTAGGKTTVKVTFHNSSDDSVATLIPAVAVDFSAFQTDNGTPTAKDVTQVDISGLSAGKVSLYNVPIKAAADIVGLKGDDADVDFFPTYELADGATTITLPSDATQAANGKVWTYAVTASEKDASGLRTYSIGSATVAELEPVGPCFVVEKTVDEDGNVTYSVTYEGNDDTDNLGNLDELCWANGVTVDATGIAPIDGKTVTIDVEPDTSGVETYTVNTQNGVIVTPDDQVAGNWTTSPATSIKYYDETGKELTNQWITLPTAGTTYWEVEKLNDGNNEIRITKSTATPPTATDYISLVNDNNGKVTVKYLDSTAGDNPTIPLSDIGVNVTIKAESAGITTIDITDGGKGKDNCVDYAVTAYAGTTITGKGTGDADVTWNPLYKNAAVIDLDALAASTYESGKTYYYAVAAGTTLDAQGYYAVELASTTPATEVPGDTVNYFAVKKDKGGVYTVTYVKAKGENAITLSAGKATLSVNGNETITSITETVAGGANKGDVYFVDQATDKLASIKEGATEKIGDKDYVEFVEVSRWTYSAGTEIDLSDWADKADRAYKITKTNGSGDDNAAQKGVTSYELQQAAITDGGITFKYHEKTTTEDAYIEIVLTQGTLTKAEIEAIANSIKINATLNGAIKNDVVKIVLTDDSKAAISYNITNLSGEIGLENFTSGKDTVSYATTYVMGEDNTITLAAAAEGATKETTVYYAVTATDGKDTKGVRTVSVSKTPIAIAADATPAEIAEALANAGGNYFKVVTEADGAVKVTYVNKDIDLDDLKVNVDATAVTATDVSASTSPVIVAESTDSVAYTVSGLDVGQTAGNGSSTATVTSSYNESFAITYDKTADDDALNTSIVLGDATSGTAYYEVVRAEGSALTQGVVTYKVRKAAASAPASGHYFAVKYAATGVSITYYNVDGSTKYNLASVIGTKPQITVDAADLNKAITAINITDGGSADTPAVNYALKAVSADVEVVGQGEGDTVTRVPSVVLADGQKITLTDNATTYYVVSEESVDAKGKVTVVIGEGTTEKPADSANYFVVKRSASEATGKVSYTIDSYHVSNGADAYDLSGDRVGTITVDATKATGGIDLNNTTAIAHYNVVNVPEFYVPDDMNAGTVKDTVAYATTFAWPTTAVPTSTAGTNEQTYTYLVAADSTGAFNLTTGETATTSTEDITTKYASVTVTKDEKGNFKLTVGQNFTVDATTGKVDQNAAATSVTSIVAPSVACELDATGVTFVTRVPAAPGVAAVTPEITGVANGATVTVADQDVTIVSGTLQADGTITIIDDDTPTVADDGTKKVYTAGAAGTIAIRHNTDAFTVETGALVLSAGATNCLTSSVTAAAGIKNYAELTAEGDVDGKVVVTFDAEKGITAVTGLDLGETLTLREGTAANDVYTYTRTTDGYVIRTQANDSSKFTYAAMDASTTDILSLGYNADPAITGVVGTFVWNPGVGMTYYLNADTSGATIAYGTGTGNVVSGSVYIKAVFDGSDVLTLTPMMGNSKGLLDPIENYAGTITIKGDNHVVKYTKDASATYTVAIDGVTDGSQFTNLGTSDTVKTESLDANATIAMTTTENNTPVTYTYKKTGDAEALEFTGVALTKGTVLLDDGATAAIRTSDGSKITYTESSSLDGVRVVVADGKISKITDLDDGETVTVVDADGVKTVFTSATSGTAITKTVTAADGSITKTAITITAGADVWNATGKNSVTAGAFAWDAKGSGLFLVDANGAATVVAGAGASHDLTDGEVFVKATITDVATAAPNAQTFTLTPMIVKNGELVEASSTEVSVKTVTITGASKVLNYDGTGKAFNIVVNAAGVGSTFTNLLGGDLVSTTLGSGEKISVNGQEWTSTTTGNAMTIYSESPLASRIVAGTIALTAKSNTVNAASSDGTTTQTLTYTAGEDNADGVMVVYTNGAPSNITGLNLGESVKVEAVGTDGKKVVTEYTTAEGSTGMVVYRNRGGVVTVKEIASGAEIVDEADPGSYNKVTTTPLGAFDWTEAATKKQNVTGYFLASEKGVVEAATRTEELTTDYTQYGRTYLVATVTAAGGVTLSKATVGMTGALGNATTIAEGDKLDVTLTLPTAGLKLVNFNRGALKSLTITNAAAGSTFTSWTENDSIKTVSLAADDTVKLGSTTYTAGAAGVLELTGTYVTGGTVKLATAMKTISSLATDEDTGATTVDAVTYTPSGTSDTANVTVTDGRVTGLTGFGAGESLKVVTTVTDKFGVETSSTVNYTAEEITKGLDKGSILVKMTTEDGTSYTHTFKDDKQDVLSTSVTWNPVGQDVTTTKFNWNNTGYFHAAISSVEADAAKKIYVLDTGKPVAEQTAVPTFKTGDYYLKVTATKAMSGLVTITDMSFVQMQSNGTFAAVKAGETLPKFAIDATTTGGIAFAEGAHPDAALTITPAMGKTYTGLVAGDKIGATTTAAGQTITVNGVAYTVTNASAFVINGDTTIESGTFTITDSATASAEPQFAADTVTRSIAYTAGENNKDGVVVTFAANDFGTGSEIGTIMGLEAGEKVVLTNYVGSLETVNIVTTITADANNITKTITSPNWPKDADGKEVSIVMKKALAVGDVNTMTGFQVANKFDFGATSAGSIGFFKADNTNVAAVNVQAAAPSAFTGDSSTWVMVGAATDSTTKNVTINYLRVVTDNGSLDGALSSLLKAVGGVTIDASKLSGGITLGSDAVQLCTVYKKVVDATTGAVTYEVDKTKSDTDGREYGIAVSGAQAGKAYNGFTELDTIAAGALKADDTITVNGLTYAVKSAAAADAVQFYGNGAAKAGEFKFNSTYKEARGYNGATLTTVTGSADATVAFTNGNVSSITEIGVGETVTVTETNTTTNATKVTTYVASANTDGTIKITRTVVEDGVTTTATGKSAGDVTNITKLTYSDATASISSDFDWTVENGSGYFFAEVTLDGSTVKDIGSVDIKPGTTAITAADAGKYVLKVTVNTTDGTADKIRLHKVLETGELGDEIAIPATATGTLNITAPTVEVEQADGTTAVPALVFDKTGYTKLAVNVSGATAGSVVTALAKGDTLTTATLKKAVEATTTTAAKDAEQVQVNGTAFVAGADGKMSFVDAGVLVDGTIVMDGALTVYSTGAAADKYVADNQVTIAHTGTDAAVVTVANGVVTAITGLTTGTVQTTIAATSASATYGKNSVTVALGKANTSLTTLAMAEGDTVKFGTPQKTLVSGAANNKLEFVRESTGTDVLAKNGVLRLTKASDGFTAAGSDLSSNTDNVTVSYTKKTTGDAVNVRVTNGTVSAIRGLKAGDELQLVKTGETTKYTVDATTPTKVTKTVTKGTTEKTTYTAFITEGADILAANYFGEGQDISEEKNQIVGQLNWADVSGRATGYFEVKSDKTTIAEQSQKVTVTAGKGKTALWAVANAKTDDDDREVLTIDALEVQTSSDGTTTTVLGSGVDLLAGASITVTAPTAYPLAYNKGTGESAPTYAITLNKVANGSLIQNIALGDKVVTNTLKAATYDKTTGALLTEAESVTMVEADGTTEVVYTAGANGTMTFVGEGENAKATSTAVSRLLSGTVKLTAGGSIYLAGGADDKNRSYSGDTNDLTVTATGDSDVVVKAAKGIISSVTGLDTYGATLEVKTGAGTSATTVKYTVVGVDSTAKTIMIERVVGTNGVYAEDAEKTYRTVKTAADFYAGDQTKTFKAMELETPTLTDWTAEGTKYAFVNTANVATAGEYVFTTTAAKTAGVTSDVLTEGFSALPNTTYIRLTAKTAKNGMTTITAVDAMEADASSKTGKLVAKKAVNGVSPVYGTVKIDGATASPASETNGKITFALPAYTTKRYWTLDAQNLALGSVISGLTKQDKVASADGTYALTKSDKTFTIYTNGKEVGTSTQVVTYAGSDGATATVKDGVLSVTNLATEKEKVTVVSDMDTEGLVTTEYLALAGGFIQKTETAADGTKTVRTSTEAAGDKDVISGLEWNEVDKTQTTVVSDFNWTLDKSLVGYFAVSNNAATAKTAKTTITAKQAATTYIAVELDGTDGSDGVVKSVRAMAFNVSEGKMEEAAEGSFTGKITIAAPTTKLTFDRTAALATDKNSIGENAQIVITGAAANSEVSNLKARASYANCDSVTTAKLKEGNVVKVGGNWYTAGVNGALGFTMQQVNGSDDERVTLTSGTIALTAGTNEGPNAAIVGTTGIVANSSITVTAATKVSKGAATTTYTVGDLGENESFQVKTYGDETITSTFKKSSSNLFYIADGAADDDTEGKYVYALNGKTSVTSSALAVTGKVPTAKGWKAVVETFTTGTDDFLTTTYGAVTVDLKNLDSRYKTDVKAKTEEDTYAFVLDKYVASDTKAAKALNASVVKEQDNNVQTLIGSVTGATGTVRTYNATYDYQNDADIDNQVGQTIKATANWSVVGSNAADTITGASSGVDTLNGAAGDDYLIGGGAADTFVVGHGADVLKSYTTGKDSVTFDKDGDGAGNNDFLVKLDGTALDTTGKVLSGVLLYSDDNGDGVYSATDDTNSVLLAGMGNGKAVSINGSNYYFGDSTKTKGKASFNFEDGAYYYGNGALENTLKVTTDKTKATKTTLGDTVTVDLSDTAHYHEIDTVDASASGNSVKLTAASTGSTLKGSSYKSTLVGGAASDSLVGGKGVDTFWFEDYAGNDTVQSFENGKDKIYLSGGMDNFAVNGNDVVLSSNSGNDSVTLTKMANSKAVAISTDGENYTNYFFNQSGKANNYTGIANATDMFVVNGAKSTAIKNFEVGDAIKLYVGVGSDFDISDITLSTTKGTTKTYSMGGQTVAINDSTYGTISASNTEVSTADAKGYVTITRTK